MDKFQSRKLLLAFCTFSVVFFLGVYMLDGLTEEMQDFMMAQKSAEALKPAVTNIYFLKTAKSGSTTLYGILARYAWKWNLTVALYIDNPVKAQPNIIMDNIVPPFRENKSIKYNMILDHSKYQHAAIEKVLHSPRSYITILRNPLPWLESYLRFFNLTGPLNLEEDRPAESFINKLDDERWTGQNAKTLKLMKNFTRGFLNLRDVDNSSILPEIEKTFFVGITDFYDESLILLRHRLRWELQDVLYIKLNVRNYKREAFNKQLYNRFCQWSPLQCIFYEHFNKSLSQKIIQGNFNQEVNHFKSVSQKITTFCEPVTRFALCKESVNQSITLRVDKSEWNDKFIYTYKDCVDLLLTVESFTYLLYYRQNPGGPCVDFISKDITMATRVCNSWNSAKDLDTLKMQIICGRF